MGHNLSGVQPFVWFRRPVPVHRFPNQLHRATRTAPAEDDRSCPVPPSHVTKYARELISLPFSGRLERAVHRLSAPVSCSMYSNPTASSELPNMPYPNRRAFWYRAIEHIPGTAEVHLVSLERGSKHGETKGCKRNDNGRYE